MGYNYQRDIYEYHQDNYFGSFSINHTTGEINTINFPVINNDIEISEEDGLRDGICQGVFLYICKMASVSTRTDLSLLP